MGFSHFKQEYPFLKEILKLYDILEETVVKNGDKYDHILTELYGKYSFSQNDNAEKYKEFCVKLLRNLFLCKDFIRDGHINCCINLDVWLYFEIKKKSLSNSTIEQILKKLVEIINEVLKNTYCSYMSFSEKIHEREKLIKLSIFNENIKIFQRILMDKSSDYYCSCRNFVIDCINIYKTIKEKHCNNVFDINKNNKDTCDIVQNFIFYYSNYLYQDNRIQAELPDTSSIFEININTEECPLHINGKVSGSVEVGQSDSYSSSTVSTTLRKPAGKTVTTALGTIVGVSSLLSLLYKFTPLVSWINTKILRKDKLLDNMKKNEQEFLSKNANTWDKSSGDTIYRIKYNSALNE